MKSFAFPGNIEPEILSIATRQVPYMRTRWFSDLVLECESMMLALLDCPGGRVIPYTASGTAAMEASVRAFVIGHAPPLVINGGTFGARWGEICRYHGLAFEEFKVPFGKNLDLQLLSERLASGYHRVLVMQHHETSSGQLFDLQGIATVCRKHRVRLVVDAIGSFLLDPVSMADSGVDVMILSSQKGLNLPPGLSFVVLAPRVLKEAGFSKCGFYCDWDEQLCNLGRGQTPFSPATHLFMQLHHRLRMVSALGLSEFIGRVRRKADAFRAECGNHGWPVVAETPSNCLTGIGLPFPARPLIEHLTNKQIYVLPSAVENMVRVTHLGTLDIADQSSLAKEIVAWQLRKEKL